jgi:hypothetical protein
LLVGVARHECRGLLIGAHGVAPAKNSLARRIKRVLDGALERAPGGWRWTSAAAFFAAGMAVPVAALQVVAPKAAAAVETHAEPAERIVVAAPTPPTPPAAWAAPAAPVAAAAPRIASDNDDDADVDVDVDVDHDPPNVHPPRPVVRVAVNGRHGRPPRTAIDRAIDMKAIGASPDYVAAIRRAAPHIRLDQDAIIQLKAIGVTPSYIGDLVKSGRPNMSADDIVQARAMGINGDYVRGMADAGFGRLPMNKLVEMRAVGVTPADVARFRRAGGALPSVDQMVQLKSLGLDPDDIEPDDSR